MRTVDPELWYKKVKKPRIEVTRTMRYGQQPMTGFEGILRASFVDAMREFKRNCSVRAVIRYGAMDDCWQKNLYILVLAVALCIGLSAIVYDVYLLENTPPLLISLQPSQSAALFVPFPAVAICSTNIFSAKALDNYVKFLSLTDKNSTYTEEEIRRNLLNFGALLNRAPAPAPVDVVFNTFLMRVHPTFNLTHLMLKLSPPCESILRRCSWRGRLLPCDRIFATRMTQLGFCCVFNARYQPEDVHTEPKVLDMVGQDFGLTVLLQNTDDFIYARRPSVGYEILVFDGSEYPLMEGGGVRSYRVGRGASLSVALSTRAERPSHTLRYYREEWRGCRLRDDSSQKSWRSSYAWCLMECRRNAIAALCACAPYTLPPEPGPHPPPLCTPDNLLCLNKHREQAPFTHHCKAMFSVLSKLPMTKEFTSFQKPLPESLFIASEKFMYYYPGEKSAQWSPALSEELQDAQECLHCIPDCARFVYSASIAYAHYQDPEKIFKNFVSSGVSLVNATMVRVFYTSEHQHQLYVVEGYLRWYEAVAIIASEWVSVMGVTVLVLVELVFYFIIRWPYHCWRRTREGKLTIDDNI